MLLYCTRRSRPQSTTRGASCHGATGCYSRPVPPAPMKTAPKEPLSPRASRPWPFALRTLLSNRIDESESESGRATSGLARGSRGRDQRSLVSHYCILLLVRSCGHYARPGGRVRPARRSRGRSAQACTSPDGCKCGQMKRPFGQLFAGVLQLGCSTDGTQTRILDVGRYVCVRAHSMRRRGIQSLAFVILHYMS